MKHKLTENEKKTLALIIEQKATELNCFINDIRKNIDELAEILSTMEDSDVDKLQFLPENERKMGEFAVKMSEASSEYFIMILNKQIHLLLKSVEELKRQSITENVMVESPFFENLDINLITFKIGDLMRCKCTSNEDEIARILEVLKTLSETWGKKLIKIIRVKNRLESGTRDVLINIMFNEICPCEIQLAVASQLDQKQVYFDKFNHFLYEIRRAYLGPIM